MFFICTIGFYFVLQKRNYHSAKISNEINEYYSLFQKKTYRPLTYTILILLIIKMECKRIISKENMQCLGYDFIILKVNSKKDKKLKMGILSFDSIPKYYSNKYFPITVSLMVVADSKLN